MKYSAPGGEFRISLESGIKTFRELTKRTAYFDECESEVHQAQDTAVYNAEQTIDKAMSARQRDVFISQLEREGEHKAIMGYAIAS